MFLPKGAEFALTRAWRNFHTNLSKQNSTIAESLPRYAVSGHLQETCLDRIFRQTKQEYAFVLGWTDPFEGAECDSHDFLLYVHSLPFAILDLLLDCAPRAIFSSEPMLF